MKRMGSFPAWWNSRLVFCGSLVLLIFLIGFGLVLGNQVYPQLQGWVASDGFQDMLSHQVSRALKVHGSFGNIELQPNFEAKTPSWQSQGRAGEAIDRLDVYGVRARFDPLGVFQGMWKLNWVRIERGRFSLRMPEDSLKEPLAGGPRPWYSFLMPQRFYCGEITTPQAEVYFPFRETQGKLSDIHLRAEMIGRDFKYFCRDGRLDFPFLPPMAVEELVVFVTREKADIEKAELRGWQGDPASASIQARIGMRDDQSISANAVVEHMPLEPCLPPELAGRVAGRVSGQIDWKSDGPAIHAHGSVEVTDGLLDGWKWLEDSTRFTGQEQFQALVIQKFGCDFELLDKSISTDAFSLTANEQLQLRGSGSYDWENDWADLDLQIDQIGINGLLPEAWKANVDATARGKLSWKGSTRNLEDIQADLFLDLSGARIRNPILANSFLNPYGFQVPRDILLETGILDLAFKGKQLRVNQLTLITDQLGSLSLKGNWRPDQTLFLDGRIENMPLTRFFREDVSNAFGGIFSVEGKWQGRGLEFTDVQGTGTFTVKNSFLKDTGFQETLVRFLKDVSVNHFEFDPISFDMEIDQGTVWVRNLNILSPGKVGVRGSLRCQPDKELDGTLYLGTAKSYLRWLPRATSRVFTEYSDGLYWAEVTVSGSLEKPEHNLDDQIRALLLQHPLALIGLGFKGISWWLGDLLGTYEDEP